MHKKLIFLLNKFLSIILILAAGIIYRLYGLSRPSIWMDEGYSINTALSIIKHGYPMLDSGRLYLNGLIHNYLLAGQIISFGLNTFYLRLPSIVFSVLFLVLLYQVARKIFNQKIALFSLFFTSFSFWQIAWARQARMYVLVLFFVWLGLYFFWQLTKKYELKNFLLFLLCLILGILNHPVSLLILIPCLALLFYDSFVAGNRLAKKYLLWFVVIISVSQIVLYFSPWSHFSLIQLILRNISWQFYLPAWLEFLFASWPIFFISSIISFFWFIGEKKYRRSVLFLSVTVFFPLIIFSFFFKLLYFRYLFIFTPAFFLLTSLFIVELTKKLSTFIKAIIYSLIIIGLFLSNELIIIPQSFYPLESNPVSSNKTYLSYTPQPNWQESYGFIRKNYSNDINIVSAYPQLTKIFFNQPGYWLAFDYLGANNSFSSLIDGQHEVYANAESILNLDQLAQQLKQKKTVIIFDKMAADRLDPEILNYIKNNLNLVYHTQTNRYSEVFIYEN